MLAPLLATTTSAWCGRGAQQRVSNGHPTRPWCATDQTLTFQIIQADIGSETRHQIHRHLTHDRQRIHHVSLADTEFVDPESEQLSETLGVSIGACSTCAANSAVSDWESRCISSVRPGCRPKAVTESGSADVRRAASTDLGPSSERT